MCDTIGFYQNGTAFFAKNSDRSANEPQVLRYFPPAVHSETTVQTTYVPVEQVRQTHGLLLSQPSWLWGGEMGVNDCGVCIGNEAVWTLGPYRKQGLTGMDMLRLALERSETARAAVDVLVELLERYGAGRQLRLRPRVLLRTISFLIMDRDALYVLETAGRHWVYRRSERAAISNRLSIGRDGDRYSDGRSRHFAARFARSRIYAVFRFGQPKSDERGRSGARRQRRRLHPCAQAARAGRQTSLSEGQRTEPLHARRRFGRGPDDGVAGGCAG